MRDYKLELNFGERASCDVHLNGIPQLGPFSTVFADDAYTKECGRDELFGLIGDIVEAIDRGETISPTGSLVSPSGQMLKIEGLFPTVVEFGHHDTEVHWKADKIELGNVLDDELGLHIGSACNDMSIYYADQFVQAEEKWPDDIEDAVPEGVLSTYPPLDHQPVLRGSITGKVLRDGEVIQTFVEGEDGVLKLSETDAEVKVVSGRVLFSMISLWWNVSPGSASILVDYEYEWHPVDPGIATGLDE